MAEKLTNVLAPVPSDIAISQSVAPIPIDRIAARAGILPEELERTASRLSLRGNRTGRAQPPAAPERIRDLLRRCGCKKMLVAACVEQLANVLHSKPFLLAVAAALCSNPAKI